MQNIRNRRIGCTDRAEHPRLRLDQRAGFRHHLRAVFKIHSSHVGQVAPVQRHDPRDALTERRLDLRRPAHSA